MSSLKALPTSVLEEERLNLVKSIGKVKKT